MKPMKDTLKLYCNRFKTNFKKSFYYCFIALGVILLDQLSKWIVTQTMELHESIPLIQGVFHLTRIEPNRGMAWGMLADHREVFMILSTLGILAFIIYQFAKEEMHPLYDIGISFVIGGGIGNMIDRIFEGAVVDFLDFCLIDFPVFNVADSFVCIGAGMMILYLVLELIREAKKEKESAS